MKNMILGFFGTNVKISPLEDGKTYKITADNQLLGRIKKDGKTWCCLDDELPPNLYRAVTNRIDEQRKHNKDFSEVSRYF